MNFPPDFAAAPVIPDHHLIRRIGEGSYGQIWLARNIVGTYRAVKVVYRASFQDERPYEREFTGIQKFEPISRSHPGLVDILQIGRNDPAGYFYYVMEVADDEASGAAFHPDDYRAKTLNVVWKARGRISAVETLHIGVSLAAALAHMHRHGLVHRDVKPSNIIFVHGQPKLADIGLVVQLSDARTFVGTEGYIPPEGPGTIQADTFGLGKVLYEISTGQDRELFPELPANLSDFPDRELVLELNEIVVKACANSTKARYRRAEEMRGDLEFLLVGRSVRRLRFVERQLARTARFAVVVTILAVAAGLLAFGLNQVRQREKRLLAESNAISGLARFEQGNLHASLPLFAQALRLEKDDPAAAAAHRLRIGSALDRSPRLLQFWAQGIEVKDICFSPDGKTLAVSAGPTVHLMDAWTGHKRLEITTQHAIETTQFSPDGARLVMAAGHNVRVHHARSGTQIWQTDLHAHAQSAEFSPDGDLIAVACKDSCAHLLNGTTGMQRGEFRHGAQVNSANFSPDGARLVTGAQDGTARIWDVQSREVRRILPQSLAVWDAAFSPDGGRIVTACMDHNVRVWNAANGFETPARMQHRGKIRRARFSPDGRWIVSAGLDRTVRVWDAGDGGSIVATLNLPSPASHAVFSPDGRRVATASQRGEIRIWDIAPSFPVVVGKGMVTANGRRYITHDSNSFRVWNALDDAPVAGPYRASGPIAQVCASADGKVIALTVSDGRADSIATVQVFTEGSNHWTFASPNTLSQMAVSQDGRHLLRFGDGAALFDVSRRKMAYSTSEAAADGAFSGDGRLLGLALQSGMLMLELATARELFSVPGENLAVRSMRFSADSSRVAVSHFNAPLNIAMARVFDAQNGRVLCTLTQHTDRVTSVDLGGRGDFIVTAAEDSLVGFWDVPSTRARIDPIHHAWPGQCVRLSSDDRLVVVTTAFDSQVFEVRTGRAAIPITKMLGLAEEGGFCADGKRLWTRTRAGLTFSQLPFSDRTPDEVMALAHHFGVAIPNALQWNPEVLPPTALRQLCHDERIRHARTMNAWHLERADAAELEKDWFAARFHLQKLLQLSPEHAGWHARYRRILPLAETHLTLP